MNFSYQIRAYRIRKFRACIFNVCFELSGSQYLGIEFVMSGKIFKEYQRYSSIVIFNHADQINFPIKMVCKELFFFYVFIPEVCHLYGVRESTASVIYFSKYWF